MFVPSSYCTCVLIISCVLILLYMCPHATTICVLIQAQLQLLSILAFSSYYMSATISSVLILLHMCPHTSILVSSYYCIGVLIPLYMCSDAGTARALVDS